MADPKRPIDTQDPAVRDLVTRAYLAGWDDRGLALHGDQALTSDFLRRVMSVDRVLAEASQSRTYTAPPGVRSGPCRRPAPRGRTGACALSFGHSGPCAYGPT